MSVLRRIRKSEALYRALVGLRAALGRGYMGLCARVGGVKPNRAFFSSFKGQSYSDSPRAISEALHRIRPQTDIVWQLSKRAFDGDVPGYVRLIRPHTPRALRTIATSRVLTDNFNRPKYMEKTPGQLYVQTWHGDRGFKKIQLDMDPAGDFPDGRQMDLAISGSDFGSGVYRSAFGYRGEILEAGMPRNDLLLRPDMARARKCRVRLGIPEDARVLTYAPTFRDAAQGRAWEPPFDLPRAAGLLSEKTGQSWVCLVRGHDQSGAARCPGAIDASGYPEMSEILLITDMLITDYSSCAGDFLLTGRRVVLYQPDRAKYVAGDRALYVNMDETGYRIAKSPEELELMLLAEDDDAARAALILQNFRTKETGRAAEAAARWIAEKMNEAPKTGDSR